MEKEIEIIKQQYLRTATPMEPEQGLSDLFLRIDNDKKTTHFYLRRGFVISVVIFLFAAGIAITYFLPSSNTTINALKIKTHDAVGEIMNPSGKINTSTKLPVVKKHTPTPLPTKTPTNIPAPKNPKENQQESHNESKIEGQKSDESEEVKGASAENHSQDNDNSETHRQDEKEERGSSHANEKAKKK